MMANAEHFESYDIPTPVKTITFKAKDPNLTSSTLTARIYRYNSVGDNHIIKPEVFLKGTSIRPPDSIDGEGVIIEADREYTFDLSLGGANDYFNGKASIYI